MARSKWEDVKARLPEIAAWLKQGLNQKQIIINLGIGKTAFEGYKKAHPELLELLNTGTRAQVEEVENSTFKAALGFYYHEDSYVKVKDAAGNERVEVVSLKKFHPPSVDAQKFILTNKDRENWAYNQHMVAIRREELAHRKEVDSFGNF